MAKMKSNKKITSAEESQDISKSAIIGTYEGECADANITNLNGLDITREVWENVFNSDVYKQAIENGWYIGFLGHPEGEDSADCQDFRKACIVMTEGHIDDNGKVYGKFNLIDTPVGRIVKAFQDAGVIFGISVRGAGDIIQNSVDPDTFIFRGFDLVTFPAFPESIPTFTAVAASTDMEKRKLYENVCASVKANIEGLDTVESINIIQSCFAKQSEEYKELEAHKAEILGDTLPDIDQLEESTEEVDPRVDSMTKMYLELKKRYDTLETAYEGLQSMYDQLVRDNTRKVESIERICSSQLDDLNRTLEKIEGNLSVKKREVADLRSKLHKKNSILTKVQSSASSSRDHIFSLEEENRGLKSKLHDIRASLTSERNKNKGLQQDIKVVSSELAECKEENLKYIEKVRSTSAVIQSKESIISSLKVKLAETVDQQARQQEASNRDEEIRELKSKIVAAETQTKSYQDAYANLYANALGVDTPNLRVTASTDVSTLQSMIRSSTSIAVKPDILEPTQDVDSSYFDLDDYDEDSLVTL